MNYSFPRVQRGPTFSRRSNLFQWGPNANFFRNPYNMISRGVGVRSPYRPSASAHAYGYFSFQIANNKGVDQTARKRRLVCAFVDRKQRSQGPI